MDAVDAVDAVDTAHTAAEEMVRDIEEKEQEVLLLHQYINTQKGLLRDTCPHRDVDEEHDDDFNHPRRYKVCRLCGVEV